MATRPPIMSMAVEKCRSFHSAPGRQRSQVRFCASSTTDAKSRWKADAFPAT